MSKSRGAATPRRGDPVQALALVLTKTEIASPALWVRNCDSLFNINIISKSRGAATPRRGDPVQILALVPTKAEIATADCIRLAISILCFNINIMSKPRGL